MLHETVVFAKGKIAQPNVSVTMIKNFTAVVWSSMLVITLISIAQLPAVSPPFGDKQE